MGVVAEENGLLGAVAGVGGAIGRAVGDMFAAEKRLNDTVANSPGAGQKFNVTKDTVLQAGHIIDAQLDSLRKAYRHASDDLRVQLADADDVNSDIAAAWNDRLVEGEGSYAQRIAEYMDSLHGLITQLRAAAVQYGHTEEEIQAAMGSTRAAG
ncbi:uncharacterized protein YukE [Saccharothrix tamanrassetensis]|uniref:Uncharacterized protein YukE n=1 Tax=Saccharothrix tamanrassetensis TaxID=1051531 RepID=A0A841CDU1_9PSEU|nr:hypothetical protein [Saccharothrix tamanrassetensis]MBB5954524.1 uncharacterized protein YukE [Saccharothrix tamanrassetensis]